MSDRAFYPAGILSKSYPTVLLCLIVGFIQPDYIFWVRYVLNLCLWLFFIRNGYQIDGSYLKLGFFQDLSILNWIFPDAASEKHGKLMVL